MYQEKGLKASPPPVWRTHRVYGCAPHTSTSILYKYGLLRHKNGTYFPTNMVCHPTKMVYLARNYVVYLWFKGKTINVYFLLILNK